MNQRIGGESMVEEWRAVVGYEGLYEVSNLGRVRSLDRVVIQKGKKGTLQSNIYKGKILSLMICGRANRHGIHLHKNGTSKPKLVARLVAEAFIPNPENKSEVDHIDTNPMNDRADNLRWVTHQENCMNPLTRKHVSEAKMGHPYWNKPWSDERRKAASERWKGRIISPEHRRKISETLKKYHAQKKVR